MEVKGNFLTQPEKNFPLDCETLNNLQQSILAIELFGNLLGDKLILAGCTKKTDGTYAEGYVFIKSPTYPNGEVIPFKGGDTSRGVKIVSEDISVTTSTTVFVSAYTSRYLAPATGDEDTIYMWNELANVTPLRNYINNTDTKIKELETKVNEHIGVVKMWAGTVDQIPEDYLLCDGGDISGRGYETLRRILGKSNVPDLRDRFIVGYNNENTDYCDIGNTGGSDTFMLTSDMLPPHTHQYTRASAGGLVTINNGTSATQKQAVASVRSDTAETTSCGDGKEVLIDMRPPYYVLAFIIKAK